MYQPSRPDPRRPAPAPVEGTDKAKASCRYKGRPADADRNAAIATMLWAGAPWHQIEGAFGCSRSTIARVRACMGETVPAGA